MRSDIVLTRWFLRIFKTFELHLIGVTAVPLIYCPQVSSAEKCVKKQKISVLSPELC